MTPLISSPHKVTSLGAGCVSAELASPVQLGREICGSLCEASAREWLVTNEIAGFASGTVAGMLTRRYHGLLIAALKPPLGRTLLVAKLEEMARYAEQSYPLSTDRWKDGILDPQGYRHIEHFRLDGTTPIWTFACADALLEKRIWMQHGVNTTYVQYSLTRASRSLDLELKTLVNYRDYHAITHAGDWRMNIEPVEHGLRISAFGGAVPIYLFTASGNSELSHDWYRNFDLSCERSWGLDDREDHLHAGTFRATLRPGESLTLVCTTDNKPELDGSRAWDARVGHEGALLERWTTLSPSLSQAAPSLVKQQVLSADQFTVSRPLKEDPSACSVIAGYHWFGDWGRDTMIALPGLTISTGRTEVARNVLCTFGRFVDRGMLPNVFPDAGETPEYNTVDEALWYFEAIRQYFTAKKDERFLSESFRTLAEVIDWYKRGTRYNIHVDPTDGLLSGGEPGVQLTWMDAKVGDWVVTPRIGKPIEVNALWLNALVISMSQFAAALNKSGNLHDSMAQQALSGFQRFWNDSAKCCFDVVDRPDGQDFSPRPNQIFAVSLPESTLTNAQQRAVVDACACHHIQTYGLGTASEIFDGDAPFPSRGCVAQAWTVGELIRTRTAFARATDAAASNVADGLATRMVASLKEGSAANSIGEFECKLPRYFGLRIPS